MNEKFTPGPWTVIDPAHRYFRDFSVQEVDAEDSQRWVALTQHPANAHLIAAAPDLLAALRRIIENCRDADCGDHCSNACMFCQARAAIAQAEGRDTQCR